MHQPADRAVGWCFLIWFGEIWMLWTRYSVYRELVDSDHMRIVQNSAPPLLKPIFVSQIRTSYMHLIASKCILPPKLLKKLEKPIEWPCNLEKER